jgi:alpha-L-fucosidase
MEKILLPGLRNEVSGAYFLADEKPIPFERSNEGVALSLPEVLPDEATSIVVLGIEGAPDVDLSIRQQKNGLVVLHAHEAKLLGPSPRYEVTESKDHIGYWGDPADSVEWSFILSRPGRFELEITYACQNGCAGSEFDVLVGDQRLTGKTRETGTWSRYASEVLGQVGLDRAGSHTITVQPKERPPWKSMGLKRITLRPVR